MRATDVRRVTLVAPMAAGGLRAHVRMLAAGLRERGIDVAVAGPARAALDVAGTRRASVEITGRPRPGDAKAVLALRRLLAASRPDAVHAHGMRAGALTALALAGRPARDRPGLLVTVHNAPPDGGGTARLVYLALERVVARRADLVLAVSSDLERRMRAAGARAVERALVPAAAAPSDNSNKRAVPDDGRPLVLAVGRLAPQKDFATLIDAAAAWQHLVPRPRLLIAGDGPLRADLEARAAERQVDAEFPGRRDDIGDLLARASVFVMPSRWEGQPLALQEALAAGVPVVASDAGGIPDLAGRDGAAVLVEPGDARRLGQAVLSVLEDDVLSGRLRDAARRRAGRLPAPDDAVTAAISAYARVRRDVQFRETGPRRRY